jgi:putative ABC transport system permease protein
MRNWDLPLAALKQRPLRSILSVICVVFAITSIVAVFQGELATREKLNELKALLNAKNLFEIRDKDGGGLSVEQFKKIEALEGVTLAAPVVKGNVVIYCNDNKVKGIGVGTLLERYTKAVEMEVLSGTVSLKSNQILLDKAVAQSLKVESGGNVKIQSRGFPIPKEYKVVGITSPSRFGALQESSVLVLSVPDGGRLFKSGGKLNSVTVEVKRDSEARIKAELAQIGNAYMEKIGSSGIFGTGLESLISISLFLSAALAGIAAAFIVFNSFLMSSAERESEFATMKLIGATPGQVMTTVLQEALIVGLIGAVIGCILGWMAGNGLASGLARMTQRQYVAYAIDLKTIGVGVLCGMALVLCAAAYPSVLASRVNLQAAFGKEPTQVKHRQRRLLSIGILGIVLSGICMLGTLRYQFNDRYLIVSFLVGTISLVLVMPSLTPWLARLICPPFERMFPVEGELARHQILDNPARTAHTASIIMLVTTIGLGMGNTITGVVGDIESWFTRTITADFLLRATEPQLDLTRSAPVSHEVEQEIQSIKGIKRIDRASFLLVTVNGKNATLISRELSNTDIMPINVITTVNQEFKSEMLAGKAVLSTILASRLNIKSGDTIEINAEGKTCQVEVAALASDYNSGGEVLIMDRSVVERLFSPQDVHVFLVDADPAQVESVGIQLADIAQSHSLIYQELFTFRQVVRKMISGVTTGLWGMLGLGLLVACFGIVNSVSRSVIEQTRYIGLMRVVGMTRGKVGMMVVLQAALTGLIGLLPGFLAGICFAAIIAISFNEMFGIQLPIKFDAPFLLVAFLISFFVILLASLPPMLRAIRLDPLGAIRDE